MMHVTFVKKILSDGSLCNKCQEVSERLESEGLINSIDRIAIADERDAESEGMRLAKEHQVGRAPFFLVTENDETIVYDIYFKFKKHMAERGVGTAGDSSL